MNRHDSKLEEANKRTLEIYKHIGCLSTYFAGLETELLHLTAKLINPDNPSHAEAALSNLSLQQTINAFNQTVTAVIKDSNIEKEAKEITKQIREVSVKRNDIMHSEWIAYTNDNFGQHRARLKGKQPTPKYEIHTDDPVKFIDNLSEKVLELIFELSCLEDNIGESRQINIP